MILSALLLATNLASTMGNPLSDNPAREIVTYHIEGKTVIGSHNARFASRDSEFMGRGFLYTNACTPGNCDCEGNNGCWWWSDQPYPMCRECEC